MEPSRPDRDIPGALDVGSTSGSGHDDGAGAPENLGGLFVRVTVSAGRLRVAPLVPWALPTLQGATVATWIALYLSGAGVGVSSLIVCIPWSILAWKRAWRRAERGVVGRVGRGLLIEGSGPTGGYRDPTASTRLQIDGRSVDPSQVGGVSMIPSTTVTHGLDGRIVETPGSTEVYLHVAGRPVFVLSAAPDNAARVAALLCERLRVAEPRTLLPRVAIRMGYNPRTEAGRRAFAGSVRSVSWTRPRSPMRSQFYGGWRVLGAVFAVYFVSAAPIALAFKWLSEDESTPRLAGAFTALACFLVADQLSVTLWGWIFRAPTRQYVDALFGVQSSDRSVR